MALGGTRTFIIQRGSAVLLLPLVLWFLVSLIGQLGATRGEMQLWLSYPTTAILMALLVIVATMHMRIGLNEVIEDYIHGGLRAPLQLVNWAVSLGVAGVAAISALSLAF